jgi:hypothetical protein
MATPRRIPPRRHPALGFLPGGVDDGQARNYLWWGGADSGEHEERVVDRVLLYGADEAGKVDCLTDGAIHPGAQLTRARFSRSVTESAQVKKVLSWWSHLAASQALGSKAAN